MTAARALDERPAMTVAEVARLLSCDDKTVRREIDRGRLGAFRVGREWRITWAAVEAYQRATSEERTATSAVASGGPTHPDEGAGLSGRLTRRKPSNDLPPPSLSLRARLGLGPAKRRRSKTS